MPVKFSIGLGRVGVQSALISGKGVTTVSGTIAPSIPGGTTNVAINGGVPPLTAVTTVAIDPSTTVSSLPSTTAYHSTLFEDFQFAAVPTYNFYTSDEQTNAAQDPSASLGSLPRYIELYWRTAPVQPISVAVPSKTLKAPDNRLAQVPPALDVSVAKTAVANGYVAPGVISALVVPPLPVLTPTKFDEDGFLLDPASAGDHASTQSVSGSAFVITSIPSQASRTRVEFVDPSIAGALAPNRVAVASDQVHLTTLGSLAKLAPALEVISEFNQDILPKNAAQTFPISSAAPTFSYIGYVIERYTLGPDGSMTLSQTFNVSDPRTGYLIDRNVTYGTQYVYRIRSIVQWAHPGAIDFLGLSTLSNPPAFDVTSVGPSGPLVEASFYSGEWSDWARTAVIDAVTPAAPDELRVWPRSPRGLIRVTWKMPADQLQDLASVRLLRATVDTTGIGDWVQLTSSVPANGAYDDTAVVPYETGKVWYVYAMYSVSFHGSISPLSEQVGARLRAKSYSTERPIEQVRPPEIGRAHV